MSEMASESSGGPISPELTTARQNKVIGAVLAKTPQVCQSPEELVLYEAMLKMEQKGYGGWEMISDVDVFGVDKEG